MVIIDAPIDKPVGFLDYILCGGLNPILKLGLFNALKYLKLSNETECVVKSIKEPRWHLYFLVVEPRYQGKGIGADAINSFLIPFVKEKKGKLITVTTNAKHNCKFYTNNGFSLIKKETLIYKDRTVDNWSFRIEPIRNLLEQTNLGKYSEYMEIVIIGLSGSEKSTLAFDTIIKRSKNIIKTSSHALYKSNEIIKIFITLYFSDYIIELIEVVRIDRKFYK